MDRRNTSSGFRLLRMCLGAIANPSGVFRAPPCETIFPVPSEEFRCNAARIAIMRLLRLSATNKTRSSPFGDSRGR
jgi:hypothetical protein